MEMDQCWSNAFFSPRGTFALHFLWQPPLMLSRLVIPIWLFLPHILVDPTTWASCQNYNNHIVNHLF